MTSDQERAEARHHVERVIEELDVVGPLRHGEVVRGPCTVLATCRTRGRTGRPGTVTGLSSRRSLTFGWPIMFRPARGPLSKRPSIAASATGWCSRDELRLGVARREREQHARHESARTSRAAGRAAPRGRCRPWSDVERAESRHDERRRHDARRHVVRVLRERPRVQQERPGSFRGTGCRPWPTRCPTGCCMNAFVADDEAARDPAPDEERDGREEVPEPRRAASRRRRGARGRRTRGRRRTGPPSRACDRSRCPRSARSAPSSSRTGTPSGCRSRRRSRS